MRIWFLLCLLLCPAALADALKCARDAAALAHPAEELDSEYENLRERLRAREINSAHFNSSVGGLLNRLFFPLVTGLRDGVEALSPAQIQAQATELRATYPLQIGHYGMVPENARNPHRSAILSDPQAMSQTTVSTRPGISLGKMSTLPEWVHRDQFVYVSPDKDRVKQMGFFHQQLSTFTTPVGPYGQAFAERMLRTTQVLTAIAEKETQAAGRSVALRNHSLIEERTSRGQNSHMDGGAFTQAPVSSLLEGITSFNQMVNLMLAQKIPGIETGEDALKAIVFHAAGKRGLTTDITFRMPPTFVGPSTMAGYQFNQPTLIRNADGSLALSDALKKSFEAMVAAYQERIPNRPVCPMAQFYRSPANLENEDRGPSGVQIIAETFWRVFEAVGP